MDPSSHPNHVSRPPSPPDHGATIPASSARISTETPTGNSNQLKLDALLSDEEMGEALDSMESIGNAWRGKLFAAAPYDQTVSAGRSQSQADPERLKDAQEEAAKRDNQAFTATFNRPPADPSIPLVLTIDQIKLHPLPEGVIPSSTRFNFDGIAVQNGVILNGQHRGELWENHSAPYLARVSQLPVPSAPSASAIVPLAETKKYESSQEDSDSEELDSGTRKSKRLSGEAASKFQQTTLDDEEALKKGIASSEKLTKREKEIAAVYHMDKSDGNRAIDSQIKAEIASSSGLLYPLDPKFSFQHPGRVVDDSEFSSGYYSKPQIVWVASARDSTAVAEVDYERATPILYPHYKFPVQPDMQCVVHSILLACRPDIFGSSPRNASTGMNDQSDQSAVVAFRKEVGDFVMAAYAADHVKHVAIRSALGLGTKKKEWETKAAHFRGAGSEGHDFASVVAVMENAWLQEVRYQATGPDEHDVFGAGCDFDALNGLVRSTSAMQCHPSGGQPDHHHLFPFDRDASTSQGEDGTKKATYLLTFSIPDSLTNTRNIGHSDTLFPAPSLLLSTLNNPLNKLEPSAWTPVIYKSDMSFFLTPYHQFTHHGDRFHIRSGSLVRVSVSDPAPAAPAAADGAAAAAAASATVTLSVIVVSTYVKLSVSLMNSSLEKITSDLGSSEEDVKERASASHRAAMEFNEKSKEEEKHKMDSKNGEGTRPKAPQGFFTGIVLPDNIDRTSMHAIRTYIEALNSNFDHRSFLIEEVTEVKYPTVDVMHDKQVYVPVPSGDSIGSYHATPTLQDTKIPQPYLFTDAVIEAVRREMQQMGLEDSSVEVQTTFDQFIASVVVDSKAKFEVEQLELLKKVWTSGVNFGDDPSSVSPLCLHSYIKPLFHYVVVDLDRRRADFALQQQAEAAAANAAAPAALTTAVAATPEKKSSFIRPAESRIPKTKKAKLPYGDYYSGPAGPGAVVFTPPPEGLYLTFRAMDAAVRDFWNRLGDNSLLDSNKGMRISLFGSKLPTPRTFWYSIYEAAVAYFQKHPTDSKKGKIPGSFNNHTTYLAWLEHFITIHDPQLWTLTFMMSALDERYSVRIVARNLDGWRDLHPYNKLPGPSSFISTEYEKAKSLPLTSAVEEEESISAVSSKTPSKAAASSVPKPVPTPLQLTPPKSEEKGKKSKNNSPNPDAPSISSAEKRKLAPIKPIGKEVPGPVSPIRSPAFSDRQNHNGKRGKSDDNTVQPEKKKQRATSPIVPTPGGELAVMMTMMYSKMEENQKRASEEAKQAIERVRLENEQNNLAAAAREKKMEDTIERLKTQLAVAKQMNAHGLVEADQIQKPRPFITGTNPSKKRLVDEAETPSTPPHQSKTSPILSSEQLKELANMVAPLVGKTGSSSSSSSGSSASMMSSMMSSSAPSTYNNALFGMHVAHNAMNPYMQQLQNSVAHMAGVQQGMSSWAHLFPGQPSAPVFPPFNQGPGYHQ